MKKVILKTVMSILSRKRMLWLSDVFLKLGLWGIGVGNLYVTNFYKRLSKVLPTDITVVDVGAGEGNYISIVRSFFPGVFVWAFEAHPVTYKRLKKRFIGNTSQENTHIFGVGLSDAKRKAMIFDYAGSKGTGHASLEKEVIEKLWASEAEAYPVEVTTLDNIAEQHNISRIDILKIDVEGKELNVINGARQLLEKGAVQMIQFEFNKMNIITRTFMYDFIEVLPTYDFYRVLYTGELYKISELEFAMREFFHRQEIVCLLKDSQLMNSLT